MTAKGRRRLTRAAREATAHHEAGHAIIAHVLGIRVRSISIEPQEHFDGVMRHAPPIAAGSIYNVQYGRNRLQAEKWIKVALAGGEAQRRHRPSSFRHSHVGSDNEVAADLALMVCGSEASATAFLRWLEVTTAELVKLHGGLIDALAAELLERRTMSGADFRSWLARAISERSEECC